MKRIFLLIVLFAAVVGITKAQDGINYQAVVRDDAGELLKNEAVSVEFSIVETSTAGVKVYTETHALTTNNFGNMVALIGQGTPTLGTFNAINWSADKHFLNVVIDGTDMGTTEFLSVPYALHAKTADELTDPIWQKNGTDVYNDENSVVIGSDSQDANKLTVTEGHTSGELVDFKVDTLNSNSDLLNLDIGEVDGMTAAQFIEMIKGNAVVFRFNSDGELNKPSQTGNANMLPIAYGSISSTGVELSGTSNIGIITNSSTGIYTIEILNETINNSDYVVIVNTINNSYKTTSWGSSSGKLRVYITDNSSDVYSDGAFSFVIYKP